MMINAFEKLPLDLKISDNKAGLLSQLDHSILFSFFFNAFGLTS